MTTLPSPEPPAAHPAAEPADVVVRFLRALAAFDVDAALDLVADDLVYANVSLPTIYGPGPAGAHRPPVAAARDGWASTSTSITWPPKATSCSPTGSTSSTSAVSPRASGSTAASSWARTGRSLVWRDSFDWLDVTIGNLRGLAGLVSPSLNRQMPAD